MLAKPFEEKVKASDPSAKKTSNVGKKRKVLQKIGKKRAGFKTKRKSGKKAAVAPSYGQYDLSRLPRAAFPDRKRANNGAHSYTLNFNGVVEVLLQKEAYFVKKISASGTGPLGQVSWSRYGGPVAAFQLAVQRAGLERPTQ